MDNQSNLFYILRNTFLRKLNYKKDTILRMLGKFTLFEMPILNPEKRTCLLEQHRTLYLTIRFLLTHLFERVLKPYLKNWNRHNHLTSHSHFFHQISKAQILIINYFKYLLHIYCLCLFEHNCYFRLFETNFHFHNNFLFLQLQ